MNTLYLSLALTLAAFNGVRAVHYAQTPDNITRTQKTAWQNAYNNNTGGTGYKTKPFDVNSTYTDLRGLVWQTTPYLDNIDSRYFTLNYTIADTSSYQYGFGLEIGNMINNYGYLPLYMPQNGTYCEAYPYASTEKSKFFDMFTYKDRWNGTYQDYISWDGGNDYTPTIINNGNEIVDMEIGYAINTGSAYTMQNGLSSNFNTSEDFKAYDFFYDFFFYDENNATFCQNDRAILNSWANGNAIDLYYPIDLNRGIVRNRLYNRPLVSLEECADYINDLKEQGTANGVDASPFGLFLRVTLIKDQLSTIQYKARMKIVIFHEYKLYGQNQYGYALDGLQITNLLSVENEQGERINISDATNWNSDNTMITYYIRKNNGQVEIRDKNYANPFSGKALTLVLNFGSLNTNILMQYNSALGNGLGNAYDKGYSNGYNAAMQVYEDRNNVFSLIGQGFNSMASILTLELFPGLTLGLLLFVPFIVGMLIFLVKMLRN